MVSDKVVFLVAVVGVVSSNAFPMELPLFRDSFKVEKPAEALNEPFQDTILELVTKSPPKFPKKFDPLKDSALLSKGEATDTDPASIVSTVQDEEGQGDGLFKIPLYRQDFIPPSDQSGDSSLRQVVIYSRNPYDVEDFPGIPGNNDSASYSKTLSFIMDLLKRKALETPFEDETSERPKEEKRLTKADDVHSIYTSEGEFGELRLTRKEEELLSSIMPSSS